MDQVCAKYLKFYKKLQFKFHKQDREIKCAIVCKRYSRKKTCSVNAPCWFFNIKILKNAIYLLFLVVFQFKLLCISIINQHKIVIKWVMQFLQHPLDSDM